MALKDLVADASKLDEEAIEAIIADYARYDPATHKIILTPIGTGLRNESKILLYLVAMAGWKYVVDQPDPVATKPSDLEGALGISGGTLRPILKKLKDSHMVSVNDGRYAVQSANLESIRLVIDGGTIRSSKTRKASVRPSQTASANSRRKASGVKKTTSTRELKPMLEDWVKNGFFAERRTIRDLLERYHEYGIIVQSTSLSGLLLRAVRRRLLSRVKIKNEGKKVWAYMAIMK